MDRNALLTSGEALLRVEICCLPDSPQESPFAKYEEKALVGTGVNYFSV